MRFKVSLTVTFTIEAESEEEAEEIAYEILERKLQSIHLSLDDIFEVNVEPEE